MSYPRVRPTTAKAGHELQDGNIGAYYANVYQAAKDMALYFDYFDYSKTSIPAEFWTRYNPSPRYEVAVRAVAVDARRDFHTMALVVAPLSFIAIKLIWNLFKS